MTNAGPGLLALATAAVLLEAASPPASPDLLQRALDPNPSLRTYVASASLAAELHVLVPVHETFAGTAYYLKPKRKIVFSNVSGALARFKELAASTPTYEELSADYRTTLVSDDGTTSKYTLIPSQPGRRVTRVTLQIDDAAALVARVTWSYSDGGRLSFKQTYETVGAFRLPSQEDISARFPGYSVDGVLRLTNYEPNAPISPASFDAK